MGIDSRGPQRKLGVGIDSLVNQICYTYQVKRSQSRRAGESAVKLNPGGLPATVEH